VINYAARRTPIAEASLAIRDNHSKPYFVDADDSFDIADAAMASLIDGDFQIGGNGPRLFTDPVFANLAASLDLPLPTLDTINDPERIFDALQTIGQSNIAATCDVMGITAESRARSPALANRCARFGLYPNINNSLNALDFVTDVRNRVNSMYTASGLRSVMCNNIAPAEFTSTCPSLPAGAGRPQSPAPQRLWPDHRAQHVDARSALDPGHEGLGAAR